MFDFGVPAEALPVLVAPGAQVGSLDRTVAGLSAALASRPGAERPPIGMFSCSKATNEVNYLAQKFARAVVGSNNIDSCNRT